MVLFSFKANNVWFSDHHLIIQNPILFWVKHIYHYKNIICVNKETKGAGRNSSTGIRVYTSYYKSDFYSINIENSIYWKNLKTAFENNGISCSNIS